LEPIRRRLEAVEHGLLGGGNVGRRLLPGVTGQAVGGAAHAARRGGHIVSHADQRHDALQLAFVVARAMQPDQQRVGVVSLVMQRSEQRMGYTASRSGKQGLFYVSGIRGRRCGLLRPELNAIHGVGL